MVAFVLFQNKKLVPTFIQEVNSALPIKIKKLPNKDKADLYLPVDGVSKHSMEISEANKGKAESASEESSELQAPKMGDYAKLKVKPTVIHLVEE